MPTVRILSDGRRVVRTSIDLDEDVYYAAKEARLPLSSLFNAALLDYFGKSSLDADIVRMRQVSGSVSKVAEINRLKAENQEKRQAIAVAAVHDRIDTANAADLEAAATIAADTERQETRWRKFRDTWIVMDEKAMINPGRAERNLPENDNGDDPAYWPRVASAVSKLAGEEYTVEEVIDYARRQLAAVQ